MKKSMHSLKCTKLGSCSNIIKNKNCKKKNFSPVKQAGKCLTVVGWLMK